MLLVGVICGIVGLLWVYIGFVEWRDRRAEYLSDEGVDLVAAMEAREWCGGLPISAFGR